MTPDDAVEMVNELDGVDAEVADSADVDGVRRHIQPEGGEFSRGRSHLGARAGGADTVKFGEVNQPCMAIAGSEDSDVAQLANLVRWLRRGRRKSRYCAPPNEQLSTQRAGVNLRERPGVREKRAQLAL